MKVKISFKDLKLPFLPQKISEGLYEGVLPTRDVRLKVSQITRDLSKKKFKKIEFIDIPSEQERKVAEGFVLGTYDYKKISGHGLKLKGMTDSSDNDVFTIQDETKKNKEYRIGEIYARAQNYAREFMDTPSNLMTPTKFCQIAEELFKGSDSVKIMVRDRDWVESKKMGAFLSVGRGSQEPLKFLEMHYTPAKNGENHVKSKPLLLVGKGVTFDSGGISIKPSTDMAMMKGDMGGAAVVLSTLWAIERLKLDIDIICLVPLTENMPSGLATKPGDLVKAGNGLTIEVDNTDAEGRLILADALHYATKFNPRAIIELSTLTGAIDVALGECYTGMFTKSDSLAEKLIEAGKITGDEFWRMPMSDAYTPQIESQVADLKNVGGRGGGACTAAIFLQHFVNDLPYVHLDIAGVMATKKASLISPGMTGRPTRAIIEFVGKLSLEKQ